MAWVDHISLGQYRRRFNHHQVTGRLLLQLGTSPALLLQLGITPLGHRQALKEAVDELRKAWADVPAPGERHRVRGVIGLWLMTCPSV